MVLSQDSAEAVALQAFTHLLGQPAALERFSALTGLAGVAGDELKRLAADPAFLAGVLDYYLGNEAELMEMCEAVGLDPELPIQARRRLPGATLE